jgi:hypothetical protein
MYARTDSEQARNAMRCTLHATEYTARASASHVWRAPIGKMHACTPPRADGQCVLAISEGLVYSARPSMAHESAREALRFAVQPKPNAFRVKLGAILTAGLARARRVSSCRQLLSVRLRCTYHLSTPAVSTPAVSTSGTLNSARTALCSVRPRRLPRWSGRRAVIAVAVPRAS